MVLWLILRTTFALWLCNQLQATDDIISHLKREICMEELGCFSAGPPFFNILERPLSLLPDDRTAIKTKFLLYTPPSPNIPFNFSNLDQSIEDLNKTGFNPTAKTFFVVPGFASKTAPTWKKLLVDTLLTNFSYIFLVDWTGGDGPIYEQAVANTRVVGAEIALFIQKLQNVSQVKPEMVHIIGHSLGSHVAGYAGKRLKNLGRITAMDPAGPYFTNVDPFVRLDRKDALFVDAIHTNAAPSRLQGFGMTESIAHMDFYPNGGHLQPGCKDMGHAIWDFLKHPSFDAKGLAEIECNHLRATELFTSSIDGPCNMMGVLCDSLENFSAGKCGSCEKDAICVPMGMHADRSEAMIDSTLSLNFYLNTTATPPFCKH